jgi:hypothetical protein
MAVAVLTPRNNDLESGIWTRAAPLTRLRISAQYSREKKKKRSRFLPLTRIRWEIVNLIREKYRILFGF